LQTTCRFVRLYMRAKSILQNNVSPPRCKTRKDGLSGAAASGCAARPRRPAAPTRGRRWRERRRAARHIVSRHQFHQVFTSALPACKAVLCAKDKKLAYLTTFSASVLKNRHDILPPLFTIPGGRRSCTPVEAAGSRRLSKGPCAEPLPKQTFTRHPPRESSVSLS
jgi:hypothetical protein